MATKIELRLDPENDIIEQEVVGPISELEAQYIDEQTSNLVAKLANPMRVRILVSAGNASSADQGARKLFLASLNRSDLFRVAVFGFCPVVRTIIHFLAILSGNKKVKFFASREDALRWLKEPEQL